MGAFSGSKPTPYPVTPIQDVVVTWDVSEVAVLRVEVANLDATQTVACYLKSRAWEGEGMPFTFSDRLELAAIAPGDSAGLDVECGGARELQLVAAASGVGCDILVASRKAVGR